MTKKDDELTSENFNVAKIMKLTKTKGVTCRNNWDGVSLMGKEKAERTVRDESKDKDGNQN